MVAAPLDPSWTNSAPEPIWTAEFQRRTIFIYQKHPRLTESKFLTLFIDDIIKTSKTQNKGKGPNGPAKKGAAGTRQQPKSGAKSAGNKANAKANQGAAKRNQAGQKPKQNGAQKPKQNQAQKVQYPRPGTLS